MKQAMVDYMQKPIYDELYTPVEAIEPLLEYIDNSLIVWEPTDGGHSEISRMLRKNGNEVISTHIAGGHDFFHYEPEQYDCIITNPPYSLKTDFIRRAYSTGKPFAFLLPITALEGVERGELYRQRGIELLVLDKRINFMKNKKNIWFNTSWFCYDILPQALVFATVGG